MTLRTSIFTAFAVLAASTSFAQEKITFEEHIKPIFRAKCFGCHNTDKKSAGLDLTNYTAMMQGGASGACVEPGDPDSSYLWSLVIHDSEPYMPPKQEKMAAPVLATIKKWIEGGALENAASKAMVAKPKVDLTLKAPATGKPEGPAAMPNGLSRIPVVETARATAVSALATSPWAPLVAIAGQKQIVLYNANTLELLGVLPFPEGEAQVLKFSRNGELLLAGGGRGSYQGLCAVYNVRTGERLFTVGDEVDSVLAADISSDHSMIALGGPSKMIRVYSTANGELLYQVKKHTEWVYALEFSPDGVLLATADRNGGMFVWEAHTGRLYLTLNAHKQAINSVSWRSDSNILASCSKDGSIKLWEMENGRAVKSWGAHGGGVASVEFTRDGRLASCGRDRTTKLWDQNGAQQRAFEAFSDLALRVTHCDETNRVIAGDWHGEIRVWNAADGKRLGLLTANPEGVGKSLGAAKTEFAAKKAEYGKMLAASNAAAAALPKIKADLAAAQKATAASQAQVTALTNTVNQYKATLGKVTGELAASNKTVTDLNAVVPVLKDATDKVKAAAAKLPADKELAAAAKQVEAKYTANVASLDGAKKTAAAKQAAVTAEQGKVTAETAKLTAAQTAFAASQKKVAGLTPTVKPAEDKAAAAKKAADGAAAAMKAASDAVATLEAQVALEGKLKELPAKQTAANQAAAVYQAAVAEVTKAKSDVVAATTAAQTAQKDFDGAKAALAQYQQASTKAATDLTNATNAANAAQTLVSLLDESLAKATAASQKLPNDADVKAAVAQLKTTVDKKKAALAAAKQTVATATAAVSAAKAKVDAGTKAITTKQATLTAATGKVTAATAKVQPAQAKATAAKPASDKAAAELDALKKEIDALKAKTGTVQTAAAG